VLEVKALRGGYGAVEVLRGIDLEIRAGEIVAVLGSNGAGKSTLNNTVCGLIPPSGGSVFFDGSDITRARTSDIVAAGLVQVPEGRRVFPDLTVRENLLLGGYRRGRANRSRNLERSLAVFPRLAGRMPQRAGTLSGGEQQMLAIGRGLMAEPRLLILDEPSLGLAPLLVQQIFQTIQEINRQGTVVLLVEQNANLALRMADRAYVLEAGRIVLEGSGADLLANDAVRRAYLGED